MPRIGEKRQPVLTSDEVQQVLNACINTRDRAIILFLIDTGLRRSEMCYLNWGDIELSSGLVLVRKGKGKKARSVVIGNNTRRILLKYKQTVNNEENNPLFQTKMGTRLSPGGLRSICLRLSERTGIVITPHALHRTFVVLSLKSGMSLAHVQALMGHKTPAMTLEYAKLVDDDLIEYGPVDKFF
jgi:integrase/recombinase XerD